MRMRVAATSVITLAAIGLLAQYGYADEKDSHHCPKGHKCVYQKTEKPKTTKTTRYTLASGHIQIGPYFTEDEAMDGSELLANESSNREASHLLLDEYNLEQEAAKAGITLPSYPRIVISGDIAGDASYVRNYDNVGTRNIEFSGIDLFTSVQVNEWVSGFASLSMDPNDHGKVTFGRGFVTVGNLAKSPFYAELGKDFVPFGRYSSAMISAPLTLALARTSGDEVVLGYQQTGDNRFHAETALFNNGHDYSLDAGYQFSHDKISGEVGASYLSSMADSDGIAMKLPYKIPAVDVYGKIGYSAISLVGEYATAIKSFQANDMSYLNRGATPSAYNTELVYSFNILGDKPSSVGVGYGGTSQAVALGLPKTRYSAEFTTSLIKNTQFGLEYHHDINYPTSASDKNLPDPLKKDLGKSDNAVIAKFDVYF